MHEKYSSPKFIFVLGGVMSGIGKGITSASIGKMFQKRGYKVTYIKVDPYFNWDAGTMRPTEHGEVWVTEDGGEIDQDFGHIERFLDVNIPKLNNITSGQIYYKVISEERKGKYLGKTVQFIPHIPEEIIRRLLKSSKGFDVSIVEIGGTIGDYENIPFVFAGKTISMRYESIFVLVTFLPKPAHIHEVKSKPTQHAIKEMRQLGIHPDFIIARSAVDIDEVRKGKIGAYSNIESERIISNPDVDSIYKVPLVFEKQNLGKLMCGVLGLKDKQTGWDSWKKLLLDFKKTVNIGMICKYIDIGGSSLPDSYVSVNEALKAAGKHLGVNVSINWIDSKNLEGLDKCDGILVPGGFGKTGIEGKISAIKYARENDIPFLGLCLGMQLGVIEFARNVCGLRDANSSEFEPETKYPVIDILPEQKKILKENRYGASMRLGGYPAVLKKGTKVFELYGKEKTSERHRHRYEVNPEFISTLEKKGLIFSGASPDRRLMEFMELPDKKFFVSTQAHPEFTSRFEKPNPLFLGFVRACLS